MKSNGSNPLKQLFAANIGPRASPVSLRKPFLCRQCLHQQRRYASAPADQPGFQSILDNPVRLVRQRQKHGLGLLVLAAMPITAFALGTWQVQRLDWKTKLVAKLEDSVLKPPLPLPPRIDPDVIPEFDHRRIYVEGRFRHDKEMLIGPRTHDGNDGFLVVTPLEREGGSSVLVNRGWIKKTKQYQRDRTESLTQGQVTVEGLLREPFKKNLFTPDNQPQDGKYYFPDVVQMAQVAGSEPVWIEATMVPNLFTAMDREEKGIPIGRAAECTLRNQHAQYIFTWYSLAFATSIMLWMVVKKKPGANARRVRHNKSW